MGKSFVKLLQKFLSCGGGFGFLTEFLCVTALAVLELTF